MRQNAVKDVIIVIEIVGHDHRRRSREGPRVRTLTIIWL